MIKTIYGVLVDDLDSFVTTINEKRNTMAIDVSRDKTFS